MWIWEQAVMNQRSLDSGFIQVLYRCYQECPSVYACINILQRTVMREGLIVRRDLDEATKQYYDEYINPYFVPFMREAVRELLVFGFVCYRLVQEEDGLTYPEIIPCQDVVVYYDGISGDTPRKYRATFRENGQDVPYIKVMGTLLTSDRAIDAPVHRALRLCQFERVLLANAEVSDTRAAKTPLVLENLAGGGGFWAYKNYRPEGAVTRTFHGGGQYEEEMASEMFKKNFAQPVEKVDEKLVSMQENFVSMLNTIGSLESSVYGSTNPDGAQGEVPRMNLPPHTRPVNVTFPNTRTDITRILEQNLNLVCTALGVPVSFLNPIRVFNEAATVNDLQLFETVKEIRSKLQPLLTEAFSVATSGDDFLLQTITGKEKYADSAEIAFRETRGRVQDLVIHYKEGLVPRHVVRQRMAAIHDYNLEEFPEEEFLQLPGQVNSLVDPNTKTGVKALPPVRLTNTKNLEESEESEEESQESQESQESESEKPQIRAKGVKKSKKKKRIGRRGDSLRNGRRNERNNTGRRIEADANGATEKQ